MISFSFFVCDNEDDTAINLCFGGTHHSPFVESCGSVPERFLLQSHASTQRYRWSLVNRIKESRLYWMHLLCNSLCKMPNKSVTLHSFTKRLCTLVWWWSKYIFYQIYLVIYQWLSYRSDFNSEKGRFVLTNRCMWILLLNLLKH